MIPSDYIKIFISRDHPGIIFPVIFLQFRIVRVGVAFGGRIAFHAVKGERQYCISQGSIKIAVFYPSDASDE